MLNRLYIVIGFLAIVILLAAFIAPRLMDWSGYRERVEILASEALGSKVNISGKIDFSLLPQPRMKFENIIVSSDEEILADISFVSIKFSLMDFLRDRYVIKSLVLQSPNLYFKINNDGEIITPINIPKIFSEFNFSIADAVIKNGSIELLDMRLQKAWKFDEFEGNLNLGGLRGPFALSGNSRFKDKKYTIRLASSDLNQFDEMNLNGFFEPHDKSFSIRLEGLFKAKKQASFDGEMEYRQKTSPKESTLGVSGDRLLNSKINISSDQILLSEYVFLPDENRPATRFSGAMDIILGEDPYYNAVISAGVVDVGLPDINLTKNTNSIKILDILEEIKAPIIPAISGVVGIDITELSVKGVSFRDIRIDAISNKNGWFIDNFQTLLPGRTSLSFSGNYTSNNDLPAIDGNIKIDSERMDILALSWRKQNDGNALFNMAGSLSGEVNLLNGKFALLEGDFIFDNIKNKLSFGLDKNDDSYSLDIIANFGEFSILQSRAFSELIPNSSATSSFLDVFPSGSFNLSAKKAFFFDLDVSDYKSIGSWNDFDIDFEKLSVNNLGGLGFDLVGGYNFFATNPVVFGQGNATISKEANGEIFSKIFENNELAKGLQNYLFPSLPADFSFKLEKPSQNKEQNLVLLGKLGVGELDLKLNMVDGAFNLLNSPIKMETQLKSNDVLALGKQLGFGDLALVPQNSSMIVGLKLAGSIFNSLAVDFSISGGEENTHFLGDVFVSNASSLKGKGRLEMKTSDFSPFMELVGVESFGNIALSGKANLSFEGLNNLSFSLIDVLANKTKLIGSLSKETSAGQIIIDGGLIAENLELSSLAKLLGGSTSTIMVDGLWPQGPFAISENLQKSLGHVRVSSPILSHNDKLLGSDIGFNFTWDNNNLRLRSFEANVGGGDIALDIGICCKGILSERQLNARVNIRDVELQKILPKIPAKILRGEMSGGLSFSGNGDSYQAIIENLVGDGNFTISNVQIDKFNPLALKALDEIEKILELDEDKLEKIIFNELRNGAFKADEIDGVINFISGKMRASNISIKGQANEIFGNIVLDLSDFSIDGLWKLTPIISDTQGIVIIAKLFGSLINPDLEFNFLQLIDAMKLRSLELELDRLERLQLEAQERSAAAAKNREILMQKAEKEKEEAAKKAAQEAADKEAKAQERALQEQILRDSLLQKNSTTLNQVEQEITIDLPNLPVDLPPDAFNAPAPSFQ